MTDVGTETAFRLDQRKHFRKSKRNTCGDEYVGETLRALNVRAKEHQDAVRLGKTDKSAIAQHVHDQDQPHEINWETLSVLAPSSTGEKAEGGLLHNEKTTQNEQRHWAGTSPNMALHFVAQKKKKKKNRDTHAHQSLSFDVSPLYKVHF